MVRKRLEVAQRINVLDDYRFVLDRIVVKIAAVAESILATKLVDHLSTVTVQFSDELKHKLLGILKKESDSFITTPATDEVSNHTNLNAFAAWCKIAEASKCMAWENFDGIDPLFDEEAAKLLHRISSNQDESMPLRAMAMVALATIMYRNGSSTNEASYRRRARMFFSQVTDSDYPSVDDTLGASSDAFASINSIYASSVAYIMGVSNTRLRSIEGAENFSTATRSKEVVKTSSPGPTREFASTVGGSCCDYCHKSREDASVVNFLKCESCRLAYYCNEYCQGMAWENGHKKHCKKFGCFAIGDVVLADVGFGLRHWATVVGEAEGGNVVKCELITAHGASKFALYKRKHLRHTRPAL